MTKYYLTIPLDKNIIYGIEGIYLPDYVDSVSSVTIEDHISTIKIPFTFSISTKNLILMTPNWVGPPIKNGLDLTGKSIIIEYYSVSKSRESKINQIL